VKGRLVEEHAVFITPLRSALAGETTLYVGSGNRMTGVHAPGVTTRRCDEGKCPGPHTADWRHPPGSEQNTHGVTATLRRATVREVIEREYPYEAHFVTYALTRDGLVPDAQPRITKGALPWLRAEGFDVRLTAFAGDWDAPGHVEWTPELRARFDEAWARGEGPFASCVVYLSPRGVRVIQPLETPLPVDEGEPRLRAWLETLVEAGADPSVRDAKDWTRLMRCANYSRFAARNAG